MADTTILHFFCGKMAAGKSTLARQISNEQNAILLCEDEWLKQLYPQEITTIRDYVNYSDRLKSVIAPHVIALLNLRVTVVMDFPANTVAQRAWFRSLFENSDVAHRLHYLDVSNKTCLKQLHQRNKTLPEGAPLTSDATFDAITQHFQPPEEREGFHVIRY